MMITLGGTHHGVGALLQRRRRHEGRIELPGRLQTDGRTQWRDHSTSKLKTLQGPNTEMIGAGV